ncbi:ABA4-like family protein [Streptomyces nigrescens]|uniref:ABA4-like family protein n=1 Tax=Streptomyces nigrescens TaxID=1920 RepID=UPI00346E18C6
MTTNTLFDLAFALAAPFWALLILAPGWRWTDGIAASPLPMVPVLAVYLALAVPVFPQLWAAVSQPGLAGFQELLRLGGGAGAIWAQVIAWDLFLGQWMYREARELGIHPLVMGPLLVLTVLLSPIGVLLFLGIRAGVRRRPRLTTGGRCVPQPGSPDAPPASAATAAGHHR